MPRIDGLTHVTRSGVWLDGTRNSSCAELLRQMDDAGVDLAIVTAIQGGIEDAEVQEAFSEHPDRLIGFCAPYVDDSASPLDTLRIAREQGFVGLKLHPRFGRFLASSPAVLDLVAAAVELEMPVMLCGIAGGRGQGRDPLPHVVLADWADGFPEHPFVLAHAGSHRLLDAWEMARVRENVYLDLSHTLHYLKGSSAEKDIGFVARRLDRRVLFGSDFPESSVSAALGHLRAYLQDWPEADVSGIEGGNWSRILGSHNGNLAG